MAAQELLRRRAAKKRLLAFTEYTLPGFEASWHHDDICDALERVERGDCRRLMIFAPPRHTKSELGSRRFPAWFLGRNPDKQIIATTYSGDFASELGRDVRNIVDSPEYEKIFDTRLSPDSKSSSRWHTTEGGIYVSVGVGGPITGRGAHIALIDDPFKNREDADSEVNREKVWKWYTSTLRTRLMPGGSIIIILTRWHEDDLAGRLLSKMEEQDGPEWEVVSFPAINEQGEALWPAWYDEKALAETRREVGERDWNALYQQNPVPDEGTFFKREWFEQGRYKLGDQPDTNKYQSTDFAVTPDGGDYTELGIIGLDKDHDLWVEDWWSGQESADTWVEAQLRQIQKYNVLCSFGEKGVIRRAIEPLFRTLSKKLRIYPRLEWLVRTGDKVAMARGLQGMAACGKVHIPRCEWGDRLVEQLIAFPAGKHDDAVDVLALFCMAITQAHPAILHTKPTGEKPKTDAWGRYMKDSEESWRA